MNGSNIQLGRLQGGLASVASRKVYGLILLAGIAFIG